MKKDFEREIYEKCDEEDALERNKIITESSENINSFITAKEAIANTTEVFKKMGKTGIAIFLPQIKFYQTEYAKETIAIIEDSDGSISIGIARAGRIDIEKRRVTSKDGMQIAEGRAQKARIEKGSLIEKNYLRGIHAQRIEI